MRPLTNALDGDVIDLESHQLHIITAGQADTAPSTIVHIPDLDAVVAGDVAYNGIHQWLADTDHEKRMQWIASVEQIEALDPAVVVASHKRPDAPETGQPHQPCRSARLPAARCPGQDRPLALSAWRIRTRPSRHDDRSSKQSRTGKLRAGRAIGRVRQLAAGTESEDHSEHDQYI